MKKNIKLEMEIPEGVDVEIIGKKIIVSRGSEKLERMLPVNAKKQDNKIIIELKDATKKEKTLAGTARAHIKNLLSGEDYEYRLQVCSIHFPVSVSCDKKQVIIKNFLGEANPRIARIKGNTDVKIEKDIVIVKSKDKESAGQTAAEIEKATKIRNRDRRVFQDGIYIIKKPGDEK